MSFELLIVITDQQVLLLQSSYVVKIAQELSDFFAMAVWAMCVCVC